MTVTVSLFPRINLFIVLTVCHGTKLVVLGDGVWPEPDSIKLVKFSSGK